MGSMTPDLLDKAVQAAVDSKPKQVRLLTKPVARLVRDSEDGTRWTLLVHVLASQVGSSEMAVVATMELKLHDFGKQALLPTIKLCLGVAEQLALLESSGVVPAYKLPNPDGQGS